MPYQPYAANLYTVFVTIKVQYKDDMGLLIPIHNLFRILIMLHFLADMKELASVFKRCETRWMEVHINNFIPSLYCFPILYKIQYFIAIKFIIFISDKSNPSVSDVIVSLSQE